MNYAIHNPKLVFAYFPNAISVKDSKTGHGHVPEWFESIYEA